MCLKTTCLGGLLQTTEKRQLKRPIVPLLFLLGQSGKALTVHLLPPPPPDLALLLNLTATHPEMSLAAPSASRGGKNSRENHLSPDSILLLIFSLSLSCRSGFRPRVEHLELTLELSRPMLLPSRQGLGPPCPPGSFTMAEFLLHRVEAGGVRRPEAKPQSGRVK